MRQRSQEEAPTHIDIEESILYSNRQHLDVVEDRQFDKLRQLHLSAKFFSQENDSETREHAIHAYARSHLIFIYCSCDAMMARHSVRRTKTERSNAAAQVIFQFNVQ